MRYNTMRFRDGEDRVSMLGFGCMRFPKDSEGKIDENQAEAMIRQAMDAGVNYIDTAYPYHNGDSEPFLGRILAKYPRNQFFLATKLPVWLVETPEDAERIFHEQLERLHVKYVDYYLFHALNQERFDKLVRIGLIPWAEKLKREGKIRHLGFSFHDSYEVFREILTYRQWDFCQIQYNYMDRDIQAGDRGRSLAEKMGIPLVIMEPVKGGTLAALPEEAEAVFKEQDPESSPSSWAIRWVGSQPDVKVILSGMSSLEQVEENLKTCSDFTCLSETEEQAVERVSKVLRSRLKNGCTSCRYCMPCPFGVDIPGNFAIWNEHAMYGNEEKAEKAYQDKKKEKASADLCRKCGKCEQVCPQRIQIRADLEQVSLQFGSGKDGTEEL